RSNRKVCHREGRISKGVRYLDQVGRSKNGDYLTRFSGRRSAADAKLPPGQYLTTDFPVLSAGPTPHIPLDQWEFVIDDGTNEDVTTSPDIGEETRLQQILGHRK